MFRLRLDPSCCMLQKLVEQLQCLCAQQERCLGASSIKTGALDLRSYLT